MFSALNVNIELAGEKGGKQSCSHWFLTYMFPPPCVQQTAPECVFDEFSYAHKWLISMGLPFVVLGGGRGWCSSFLIDKLQLVVLRHATGFFAIHCWLYLWKACILRRPKDKRNRHLPVMVSSSLSFVYVTYLMLTRATFDIFNCQVSHIGGPWVTNFIPSVFLPGHRSSWPCTTWLHGCGC